MAILFLENGETDCISNEYSFKTGASSDSPMKQFGSFQDAYLSMRV